MAAAGRNVAIVERGRFGATCVNTGCIPTKTWVASAYAAHMARRSADFGVAVAGPVVVDMKRVLPRGAGIFAAWIVNLWGLADILNAFYQANHAGLLAGQLVAAFFLPTLIVPLLLITHGLSFRILLQHQPEPAMQESRHLA
jgi:hypothetical protein